MTFMVTQGHGIGAIL